MPQKQSDDPRTHAVRVRCREVTYRSFEPDIIGDMSLKRRVGYGPGMPQIEPYARLVLEGVDPDPESQRFKDAQEDYQYGQLIHVLDRDYVRFKRHGNVIDLKQVDDLIEVESEVLNIETASVEDLERWIREEGPTTQDVVDHSEGNADFARKLIEAESKAHDGEPRQGVLKGLSAVISRG